MFSSDKWFGASADFYSETIDQSLRFNDGDSPYLSRTFGTPTSTTQGTWSCWFKRGDINARGMLWSGSNYEFIDISTDGQIIVPYLSNLGYVYTNGRFRDPTNWYNLVVTFDTPNATEADRLRIYVNGVRQEVYDSITLTQNATFQRWNVSGVSGTIGNFGYNNTIYFDGFLAECNWIDGTALEPSSFGETKNGVWIPKEISGLTYGNNGFRLTFADSSSLGDDISGNGNDFTSSGLASTDVVPDSPTNNFPVINKLINSGLTFSEGNLKIVNSANSWKNTRSTFQIPKGKKIYAEFLNTTSYTVNNVTTFHITEPDRSLTASDGVTGGSANALNQILGLAVDRVNDEVKFYRNNVLQWTTSISATADYEFFYGLYASSGIANFGQDSSFAGVLTAQNNADDNGIGDFYYSPPSGGFLALCSSSLPDSTISPNKSTQADDHFNTVLWSGDNTSPRTITGVGFKPDWIWHKPRSDNVGYSRNHWTSDSSRGSGSNSLYTLYPNLNNAEFDALGTNGNLTAITSDGFTITSGTSSNKNRNNSGQTFVAWNWKANGGTTTSDSTGSLTVSRQTNATAEFSIITGTTSNVEANDMTETFGHGLSGTPDFLIVKGRSHADSWHIWTSAIPINDVQGLQFNSTNGLFTNSSYRTVQATSTLVKIGRQAIENNGRTFVCYAFKAVEGYSKFGTYESNNSSDGTYVYLGFRPAFLITKDVDRNAMSWIIYDNKRDTYNEMNNNLTLGINAEPYDSSNSSIDFLSNGFKFRDGSSSWNNYSTETYIYMAFAEQPFKFSNAR